MSHTHSIYLISNRATAERYVGMTTRSLQKRMVEHANSNNQSRLTTAIKEYGKEVFTIELIQKVEGVEAARAAESDAIHQLQTMTPYGYNSTYRGMPPTGGAIAGNTNAKSCSVEQRTRKGCLVKVYRSIKRAAEITGIHRTNIQHAVSGGKRRTAGGYVWVKVS